MRKGCDLSDKEAEGAFKQIDANGNGTISGDEMKEALLAYAKSKGHKVTKREKRWLYRQWKKDGGNKDGGLDEKEFHEFANAVAYPG